MKIRFLDGTTKEVSNLYGANLRDADLRDADLYGADLRSADLYGADLRSANLRDADLRGANLRDVDLGGANLGGANLRDADLRDADLRDADLGDADLRGADLTDAKALHTFSILPAGDLIGYKKLGNGTVATLKIPAKAARVNAYGSRKCRAAYVRVISGEGPGIHDSTFLYSPGKLIRPGNFDPDPRVECSNGIHFFITREEAEEYPV